MPLYVYECKECKVEKNKIVPMKDRDSQVCDSCNNEYTRKVTTPGMVWSPTRNGGMST